MPTYHEIMTTDLATLTTAADGWDDMAKEFGKQEKAYKRDVHGISMGPVWQGLAANTASQRFDTTLNEYQNAQTEAKAIASLLRDAHTQFTDLRGKLTTARQEAIDAGMKVSDQGRVSFDTQRLSEGTRTAYHHDPDYQESVRKSVRSWQDRIDQLVKDTTDADKGVEIAFNAVVIDTDLQDGTVNGFNGQAQGDIEQYEAQNAEDIATRLADGKKVSAAELTELDRAFRDNADNKVFSQTLLKGLGPDGTIRLTNELNQLAHDDDKKHKAQYMELQGGLADTVAKATHVPGSVADAPPGSQKFKDWLASDDGRFYRQWTESLDKHGTKNYGSNTQPLYGYQSFVSLMRHGDAKYDDQFLYELGDDLISAEKKQPGIYAEWGAGHDGIRADALDGLLGVMSKNPDAATAFFDPAGNGSGSDHVANDHLKYLLHEREWPQHSTVAGPTVFTMDDPLNRTGLGAALEAAATGREPDSAGASFDRHTEAQARVMQETITQLDKDGKGDAIPQNLKVPLGRALADYTTDTHAILSGTEPNSPQGASGINADGEESSITNSKHSLLRVMRGVSDAPYGQTPDGEPVLVYDLLYENQKLYSAEYLDTARDAPAEQRSNVVGDWDNKARHVGEVYGSMTAIGSDMILDDRDTKVGNLNDAMRYTYHGVGGLFTQIPVVGDPVQRMVDAATYEYSKDVTAAAEDAARSEDSSTTSAGVGGTNVLLDAWGGEHGIQGSEAHEHAKGEAKQSFITGREDAYSALRTRK
ncbi:hypothetical protein HTV45_29175 [Streptomyces sp. CHD11]|uniref:DUF6571 family protein n=1 Tax=Streptomyces sp. CHD11 TaxID=2741325 RepID=UPI001BFC6364|nr:DUF6571 family protein [Streptomyces sp. CHD11]MBT3154895.1 hypothetical protein [Streptomyces sp. CHD11]